MCRVYLPLQGKNARLKKAPTLSHPVLNLNPNSNLRHNLNPHLRFAPTRISCSRCPLTHHRLRQRGTARVERPACPRVQAAFRGADGGALHSDRADQTAGVVLPPLGVIAQRQVPLVVRVLFGAWCTRGCVQIWQPPEWGLPPDEKEFTPQREARAGPASTAC